MRKVGFGIIGLGLVSETHAEALQQLDNAYLVGGYHKDKAKADAFASRYGVKGYTDLKEFLADPEIEAVCITTPSGVHKETAFAAIDAGKHVLIEKPIEITGPLGDEIVARAKEKGVKISGIFQCRFYDASKIMKKAIAEGRFGQITLADCMVKWYRDQGYYDSSPRRGTWEFDGGGVLMIQAIHALDLLQWFMGDVVSVSAFSATLAHERIEVEDTLTATLRFASGALGALECSTGCYPGSFKKIEICGTEGSATLEEESLPVWKFRKEQVGDDEIRRVYGPVGEPSNSVSNPKTANTVGHTRQIGDFADAIINGREPFISAEDALKSVKIIDAMYKSAREGGIPVEVSK